LKRYIGSSCLLGFLKTCAGASTLTQRQVHPKPFEPPQSASDINTRPARNNRVQAMLCQIFPISHWNVWQQFCSRSAQVWRRCFSENWRHLPLHYCQGEAGACMFANSLLWMCDDMGGSEAFQLGPVAMGPRAGQLWLTAPESALWRAALQSRLLLNARLGRLSKN